MKIGRDTLEGALDGKSVSAAEVVAMIRESLKNGERVIVVEEGGLESLLGDWNDGGFSFTPIEKKK